jgi:hypothetical protein
VQSEATWRLKAKLRLCATSWAAITWLFEVSEVGLEPIAYADVLSVDLMVGQPQ